MEINTLTIIALMSISFLAGFIDSIGGGGGLLSLPCYLIAGLPPHIALGTNKFAATFGTGAAVFNYIRKGKIYLKIILSGIVFSLVGAFIGSKIILLFDQNLVGKIFIILFPLGVIATFYPKKAIIQKEKLNKIDSYLKVPLICVIVGFYDGFFGPGSGTFLALSFYTFLKLNLIEATANAKVFNFFSTFGSLLAFIIGGKVFYTLGIPLAVTNILGNYLGSHLAIKKGEKVIKLVLIIVLVVLFITLIWKFF